MIKTRVLVLNWQRFIIALIILLTNTLKAHAVPSVWEVLQPQFMLNHEVSQTAVQTQIRWLVAHPSYIQKLARQSEPYIYHIVTEIKKRHLPGELALIPMIESSYDPFAYSGAGAAGLWQLMPGTGTDLGLKQDWWYDGRRSIRPSTDAALNYLTYLHHFFNNDWLLAFAAYDAGEGALSKIIKKSGLSGRKVQFWALSVPQETRAYIPRLLALAEVIQNPQRYHVQLPDIPHLPYFEEVNIGHQIDLNHAAKLAGISYKEMIKLNPGFNRWATAPYYPYKLLIPTAKVEKFNRNLALSPHEHISWKRHQVSAAEHLIFNQTKSQGFKKTQAFIPPRPKTVFKAQAPAPTQHFRALGQPKVLHIVQKNETYAQVQNRYRVSAHDIQTWNHLNAQTPLKPGQQLIIWKHQAPKGRYVVKNGDSLSKIAKEHYTTLSALLRLNPRLLTEALRPGEKIILG